MTLQSHQNINHQLSQLSAFGISGGRSRMPDAHVEMLLDCYKAVQEERTLDSGRLGKGAFHQITEQLNKRTAANYCKDQVTAKLQNLKAQFRQRRAAVEAGHAEMRDWKWYERMQEIMSEGVTSETYTDFDGKSRRSNSRSPTPASTHAANNAANAQYGLAGNISKIIQSLPPQIRDNPAALAQLMHTNPLLGLQAGFHQSPLTTQSPLTSLFKMHEEQDEKDKLNEAIREQSKPHALNLLQQQQNAALQRSLMARVQASQLRTAGMRRSSPNHSPEKEPMSSPEPSLKRAAFGNDIAAELKKARLSNPMLPPMTSSPLVDSALQANITAFMTGPNQPKKESITALRNLAFQLFTGLTSLMSQPGPSGDETTDEGKDESPSTPKNFSPLRIPEISLLAGAEENKPQIEEIESVEKQNESSENSKVSEIDEADV